jgi:ZIP family zinc transporter
MDTSASRAIVAWMPEVLALTLAASFTVAATGLGAVPVALLGARTDVLRAVFAGVAIGVMSVAAVQGLLVPAARTGTAVVVVAGAVAGVVVLVAARHAVRARLAASEARAWLTFAVLFVHSLPEGLAIGAAFAGSAQLGLFVVVAIAVQNVPEGTATAIPLRAAGRSARTQVLAAIASSAPQLPGALLAWLLVDAVRAALPASLALAGAAMLALVLIELVPDTWAERHRRAALAGAAIGGGAMALLAAALPSV